MPHFNYHEVTRGPVTEFFAKMEIINSTKFIFVPLSINFLAKQ